LDRDGQDDPMSDNGTIVTGSMRWRSMNVAATAVDV
jgi:hypothetical protein